MTFDIEVDGRRRHVTIARAATAPTRFHVAVDGREHVVDAVRVGPGRFSLVREGDGASLDVSIEEVGAGELVVYVGGVPIRAVVNGRRDRRGAVDAGAGVAGGERVVAPMPGKVLRVLVAAGDDVGPRRGLVVIEAMKMENELRATKTGRVKEVAVEPGMSVEAGRLLVVVE